MTTPHGGGGRPGDADGSAGADELLAFTVATVWRSERVSCPHPDLLRAYLDGGLPAEAAEFVAFHLDESACPYCNATLDEVRERHAAAAEPPLRDLRDKLLRSTIGALRQRQA